MGATYSVYEAKAKFSEVIRKVRAGQRVVITYRGKDVAKISPVRQAGDSVEARFRELQARGIIGPLAKPVGDLKPVIHRPGTLAWFLKERE